MLVVKTIKSVNSNGEICAIYVLIVLLWMLMLAVGGGTLHALGKFWLFYYALHLIREALLGSWVPKEIRSTCVEAVIPQFRNKSFIQKCTYEKYTQALKATKCAYIFLK